MTTRRAFTLVELLVVVAVIGVLVGSLLPALSGARAGAWRAAGASNIRQLQIANATYATDWDELFVAGAIDFRRPVGVRERENTHRWFGTRDAPSGAFEATGAPLVDYLGGEATSAGVRVCPAFRGTLDALEAEGAGFERGCGGYGYNNAFVGTRRARNAAGLWVVLTDDTGSRRSRFASPSRTVAFADSAYADTFSGAPRLLEYSFVEPHVWPHLPGFAPEPTAHFRHAGRANVAWLDGRVSAEVRTSPTPGGDDPPHLKLLGIGRFGEVDTNALFDYE